MASELSWVWWIQVLCCEAWLGRFVHLVWSGLVWRVFLTPAAARHVLFSARLLACVSLTTTIRIDRNGLGDNGNGMHGLAWLVGLLACLFPSLVCGVSFVGFLFLVGVCLGYGGHDT